MKKCSGCQKQLLETEFYRNKSQPDGLAHTCKQCGRRRGQEYYKANKKQVDARNKAWREDNKDREAFRQKERRKANIVQIATYGKAWRENNKAQVSIRMKAWRKVNRGRCKSYLIAYRDRRARRTPKWADLAAIEGIYAEARRLSLTVDHYYPLFGKTVSGLHVTENLRIISQSENDSKGNKHPDDFYSEK